MGGDGQDIELVINDETLLTRGQRENKPEKQNCCNEVLERACKVYTEYNFSSKNHVAPSVSKKARKS